MGVSDTKSQIDDWPTGFMLIQGNRLEDLRGLLVSWLRRHPLAPLEDEVILVQSNGIAQWLRLALAAAPDPDGGHGIAAALRIVLPARFVWQVYRAVLGALPDRSPFDRGPLTWWLHRLLADCLDPETGPETFAPLRGFLAGATDGLGPRRRYQLAERLADLLDQYQVYRADWLAAWEGRQDILIRPDGRRDPLPASQAWQPALWRALRAAVEAAAAPDAPPLARASRAGIHHAFLERIRTAGAPSAPIELPRRVIVFGISALPRQVLDVLEAIAGRSQVLLFVLNPSRHYWGDLIEGRALFRQAYRRDPDRKVPPDLDAAALHLHGHPLLAAWGRQGRDYIRLLDERDQRAAYEARFAACNLPIDLFVSPLTGQPEHDTLLRQLQDDILELRPLHERQALRTAIDPETDRSLSFIVAHSPQREVEILHDQLLAALGAAAGDAEPLQPRDVLVMVPDIATHAPHIQAVFGRLAPDDPRHIPFHVADQGERHRNPLLIGLETLLGLPRARFAVSELLDLLDIPALRARFGLGAADLPRLRQWILGANIRWGLDAGQRARLGLPAGLEQNTWRFGLRRMLLGFASGGDGPWRGIEPHDEIGGLEAALLGPLVRLLDTLETYWRALDEPRPPVGWVELLTALLGDCFTETGEADTRALDQVLLALEEWRSDCELGGLGGPDAEPLPLEIVRAALLSRLDQPTLTQRFLGGSVNFATLMPMRAIPFRQIWLLGMNDGDYPRRRVPADFDLMAGDYRPGDRSRREDDRYLFLEALLSARDRLVISWVGRGIRDNRPRPPSVLVGQLRDHLAAGWRVADAPPDAPPHALTAALTDEHPLQPFGRAYFEPGRPARLFTHASEWRAVHDARDRRIEPPPVLAPFAPEAPIRLDDLAGFLRHPVRTFYTRRLLPWRAVDEATDTDEEIFRFDGLATWGRRDALIREIATTLAEHPETAPDAALRAGAARLARAGALPMPPFDAIGARALIEPLRQPLATWRALILAHPRIDTPSTIRLAHRGLILEDTLDDARLNPSGPRLRACPGAGQIGEGDDMRWSNLVRHWPAHLAAQLDGPTVTRILGPETDIQLAPLPAEAARAHLTELLAGFQECMTALAPLACKTAFAALRDQADGKGNPAGIYEGGYNHGGERDEHPGYRRFWPDYRALSADARFRPLIDRLYGPLYRHVRGAEGAEGD